MIGVPDKARFHLLGICGTAMASLAAMLRGKGLSVSGSDQDVYPPMSDFLAELGIPVSTPYRPENLPSEVDRVVVGNAISRGNPELEEVLDRGLPCASLPEVVRELFLQGRRSIVIAGTHGKTTTTSLTAWILSEAGCDPGFLVGGIASNFGASYRLGSGRDFVIEGDEYDTAYFDKRPKFLHYLPRIAVIGNIEYDHADIYPSLDGVVASFERLVHLIPRRGLLVVGAESPLAREVARGAFCRVQTFAVSEPASWEVRRIQASSSGSRWEVWHEGSRYAELEGPLWGDAALRNAVAATAVAHHCGVHPDAVARALRGFRGVRRRLEVRGVVRGVTVVDDFAHHPTAIRETLQSARVRWPDRRIWAVYEPRSYTARSNVFQKETAEALAGADRVILAAVFSSARLAAERELSEEEVVGELRGRGVEAAFLPSVEAIVEHVSERAAEGDVVLAMSNGGFGGVHGKLLEALALSESSP